MAEQYLRPLFTADEMRAVERRYPGFTGTAPELMERAGAAVAREAILAFPDARRFAVVCGGGSNGGDGRIAARVLREEGREAVETDAVENAEVIVDALLGTGFTGALRPDAAARIARVNAAAGRVVSVDLPSGVDGSTGEVAGDAVRADLTVTFHAPKLGHVVAPGLFRTGRLVVADIGLEHVDTHARLVATDVLALVPRKTAEDNKVSAGAVLVVGGAPGMTGAVRLAAEAAFRADAGYVTVAVPAASLAAVEVTLREPVKVTWVDALRAAERSGAIAIGPGLGRENEARDVRELLLAETSLPLVLDADALHELRPGPWGARAVLTPHEGELARLLGTTSEEVRAHRLDAAQRAADTFGCVCLLKGAGTIVASPGAGPLVCPPGPPSLAVAGTGDVLTGIVAAFLAKGLEPRIAAAAGAVALAEAAHRVPHARGVVAGDVVAALPAALP